MRFDEKLVRMHSLRQSKLSQRDIQRPPAGAALVFSQVVICLPLKTTSKAAPTSARRIAGRPAHLQALTVVFGWRFFKTSPQL